jgi:hypothetical protein
MAESITRNFVSINCIDGVLRACGNTFYVSNEDMLAYAVAGDDAARAATQVGILITRYLLITDAALVSVSVGEEVLADPAPSGLADTILRGNKLEFFRSAGGLKRSFEIPARKTGTFTQSANSLEIAVNAPTAMLNFVSQYNAVVLDLFENPCTILSGKIVD